MSIKLETSTIDYRQVCNQLTLQYGSLNNNHNKQCHIRRSLLNESTLQGDGPRWFISK